MEVFSPGRDILLPVTLPLPENGPYCVYVDQDLLVLHSDQSIVKFEAEQNGHLRQLSETQVAEVYKGQNSHPVVDSTRGVFFIVLYDCCISIYMETGQVVVSVYTSS